MDKKDILGPVEDWNEIVTEIAFDYEYKYPPEFGINDNGLYYVNVYKTTFFGDGTFNRKGQWSKFDESLFPRIIKLVRLMMGEE